MYPLPLDHSLTVVEIICDASNSSEIRVKMHGHSSKVHNQVGCNDLSIAVINSTFCSKQTDWQGGRDRQKDRQTQSPMQRQLSEIISYLLVLQEAGPPREVILLCILWQSLDLANLNTCPPCLHHQSLPLLVNCSGKDEGEGWRGDVGRVKVDEAEVCCDVEWSSFLRKREWCGSGALVRGEKVWRYGRTIGSSHQRNRVVLPDGILPNISLWIHAAHVDLMHCFQIWGCKYFQAWMMYESYNFEQNVLQLYTFCCWGKGWFPNNRKYVKWLLWGASVQSQLQRISLYPHGVRLSPTKYTHVVLGNHN